MVGGGGAVSCLTATFVISVMLQHCWSYKPLVQVCGGERQGAGGRGGGGGDGCAHDCAACVLDCKVEPHATFLTCTMAPSSLLFTPPFPSPAGCVGPEPGLCDKGPRHERARVLVQCGCHQARGHACSMTHMCAFCCHSTKNTCTTGPPLLLPPRTPIQNNTHSCPLVFPASRT